MLQTECETKPGWMSWEKFFADAERDDPPIEHRLAVKLSEDSIYSFIDFQAEHFHCDPEHIGWDYRRQHGDPDGMGRDMFATSVAHFGTSDECWTPMADGGKMYDSDAYVDRLWNSFDRQRIDTDRLLIDGMDEAIHYGWKAPPDVMVVIEKLRDVRSGRATRRKAVAEAEEVEHYRKIEAEADAEFGIYEKWIANGEQESDPRTAEHRQRKRCITRFQIDADYDAIQKWRLDQYGDDDPTAEQDAAITAEWEGKMTAWRGKCSHVMPQIFTDDGHVPPGLTIPEMDRLLQEFAGRATTPTGITQMPANYLSVVPAVPLPDLIKTSAEFVQGFVPPEYVLDGVLQRCFCVSITAATGVGKTTVAMLLSAHVSIGRALGSLDVAKGTVLYFAGENPVDIQMRWLGLTQEMCINPATADVHFIPGAMPLSQIAERITAEVTLKGLRLALVVVDTAAAYFEGDDENSNAQAVEHAKRMRSLTTLPGGPCVLILCHPTKRASDDDLIPRGGGAFLAEVDGNIALVKRESLVVANAQGKFRGPEFPPLSFELKTVRHPLLKDARGRDIPTVIARPVNETDKQQMAATSRRYEDMLLKAIYDHPGASLRALATALAWLDSRGQPNAMKVSRAADVLAREKLVQKHRGNWQLTSAGGIELNKMDRTANVTYPLNPALTANVTGAPLLPPIGGR
jgi:hypothetical protein